MYHCKNTIKKYVTLFDSVVYFENEASQDTLDNISDLFF
jgi:hypothetical protein